MNYSLRLDKGKPLFGHSIEKSRGKFCTGVSTANGAPKESKADSKTGLFRANAARRIGFVFDFDAANQTSAFCRRRGKIRK
jgi:hypothetical protein